MMELYHNHYHWQLAECKQLSITSVMPETRKERGDLHLDKVGQLAIGRVAWDIESGDA